MTFTLSECHCVGAMLPPEGKSSFDEASLVLMTTSGTYLRVKAYLAEAVSGDELSEHSWQLLLTDGQAMRFESEFRDVELKVGAVLWALRAKFEDRESAVADLQHAGALLAPILALSTASNSLPDLACLVVRPSAMPCRETWTKRALAHAEQHAALQRWDLAVAACEQAFALATELDARLLGLLTLSYSLQGREQRSRGYLQMAERSKGPDFRKEIESHRNRWRDELCLSNETSAIKPQISAKPWREGHVQHLKKGQAALGSRAA